MRPIERGTAEFGEVMAALRAGQGQGQAAGDWLAENEVVRVFGTYHCLSRRRFAEHSCELSNHRTLFHGSPAHNWVGLLSRGLQLPQLCFRMGSGRSAAISSLGKGIYFGDCPATAALYCRGTALRGTRLMALCRVALGKTLKLAEPAPQLVKAPLGYDSVHGTRILHNKNTT